MNEKTTNGLSTFQELSAAFELQFNKRHFPTNPEQLYNAAQHLLSMGGKRVRPVMCLMGNELFGEFNPDAFHVANAIEMFHNFTLVHDDIMDKAPLRRGMPATHIKYGEPTALLAGDVMLVAAYEALNKIKSDYLGKVLDIFNTTARQVCEGQQMDMDFSLIALSRTEASDAHFDEYVEMIGLKTSVLLAASLRLGAILGGAGLGNQDQLYLFGKNLGIAFQVQDDYLDAFGDPKKFGKQAGGDIIANKRTFLLLHALRVATPQQEKEISELLSTAPVDKVERMLGIYKACHLDEWARQLKQLYYDRALHHLDEVAVTSSRKKNLQDLAAYLMDREE